MQTSIDTSQLVNLIYETAEDAELWPKLLAACKELGEADSSSQLLEDENSYWPDPSVRCSEGNSRLKQFSDLQSHLQRALRMNQRVNALEKEVSAAKNVLNCLPMAILTVDKHFLIKSKNSLATKLLGSSGILVEKSGKLYSRSSAVRENLAELILSATVQKKSPVEQPGLKIECREDVGETGPGFSVFAIPSLEEPSAGNNCCTLFISTNSLSARVESKTLGKYYHLTPAEARLTNMLVAGHSLAETATRFQLSQNTVRNQLKSVFAKTGTKRQAELVGLILSTPIELKDLKPRTREKNKSSLRETLLTPVEQSIVLKDGRSLSFKELGDPNGLPVIYNHDILVWQWWDIFNEDILKSMGVRFIFPYRPGFGATEFRKQLSLKTWADDIEELANFLNIDQFYLLGFSSGGGFALSCANHMPRRCKRLALVSCGAQLESLKDLENSQPAMSRLLQGFAMATPKLYRGFFYSLLKTIKMDSQNYIRNYISHWSPYDREKMKNSKVVNSIDLSLQKNMQTGIRGMVNELCLLSNNWGFKFSDVRTPTDIWRGSEDTAVSPKLADKLFKLPNNEKHILEGAGHLLLIDYWIEVFSSLITPDISSQTGYTGTIKLSGT